MGVYTDPMSQAARNLFSAARRPAVWGAVGVMLGAQAMAAGSPLADDARRVENAWVQASQSVTHMRPRFLVGGDVSPIMLRPEQGVGCVSVGVLGARTTDFTVEVGSSEADLEKDVPRGEEVTGQQSIAGAVLISRCGADRRELEGLVIRMKSPQGTLEVLVARGAQPVPGFDGVLPERASGVTVQTERPGAPPVVAPLSERVDAALRQIRETGGQADESTELRASADGGVRKGVVLEAGCHRFVASPALRANDSIRPSDTDIEVRLADGRVSRDRSFATDAMVDLCVGEPERGEVIISGVPSRAGVSLLHGRWALPRGIPRVWPAPARSAVAQALLHRRWPSLPDEPSWEGLGSGGTTVLSVSTQPGACYVLAAGATGGDVRAVQVGVRVGPRFAADNGGGGLEAGLVSFCTGKEREVRLEVDAIGARISWVAGLWRVSSIPLGMEVLP